MAIQIEISPGELVDRITILEIKADRIKDEAKLRNVTNELGALVRIRDQSFKNEGRARDLSTELKSVNERLWQIEDDIRDCERQKDFGTQFVELARAVYRMNDLRAQLKKQINLMLDSAIVEEKSYALY